MKNTAFTKFHIELGAKMAPFAGYNMPIEFSGINDEHVTCREKIGLFDVSHMGEFKVLGDKAFDFIQRVTSNNVADLIDGKVQYSCFPNDKGGIVDDLLVYRFTKDYYLLVVNAANIDKDWDWCSKIAVEMGLKLGVDFINISEDICQLAVQGPYALKAMQKLCSENVIDMEYYTCKEIKNFAGIDEVIFSTTGYTGAGGCEIYTNNKNAEKLYKGVLEAGAEFGIKNVGLGARDTLRLEMGFCLYGNDINDQTSPIEAGLGWITKFVEGKNFINRAMLEKQKQEGVSRKLIGFEMIDRGIPRQGYELYAAAGDKIGVVTSGTMSPLSKLGIGMGYVQTALALPGTDFYVDVRGRKLKAKVVKLPFRK